MFEEDIRKLTAEELTKNLTKEEKAAFNSGREFIRSRHKNKRLEEARSLGQEFERVKIKQEEEREK